MLDVEHRCEGITRQWFHKNVAQLVIRSNIRCNDSLPHIQISNKMTINLHMLGMFMKDKNVSNGDGRLIACMGNHYPTLEEGSKS